MEGIDGYQVPGYQNLAPVNFTSLNYDDRELSSKFESLEISTLDNSFATNGHRRVPTNRNTHVANDNNTLGVYNSSVDWSIRHDLLLQQDNANSNRTRAQSAALGQIGYPTPHHLSSGRYNLLNSGMMSLNTRANMYNPHAYPPNSFTYMRDGFRGRPSYYSFLQHKLEQGNYEEINMIFSEVKNCVRELMVDRTGSLLIQRVFEICNKEKMDQLLNLICSDQCKLVAICVDTHGTKSMQKLLENLITRDQRLLVLIVLRHITMNLSKNLFGRHVIQHCLIHFPSEETMQIQRVLADGCLEFATDKNGCCVVQVCAEYTRGENCDEILARIAENSVFLSEQPYGNYVVSKLVTLRIPHVTEAICAKLAGNYVSLAMNKYGSNVVETCLRQTRGNLSLQIISEIIRSPYFLMVLQDRYGNYVVQSALDISKGHEIHVIMVRLISGHLKTCKAISMERGFLVVSLEVRAAACDCYLLSMLFFVCLMFVELFVLVTLPSCSVELFSCCYICVCKTRN